MDDINFTLDRLDGFYRHLKNDHKAYESEIVNSGVVAISTLDDRNKKLEKVFAHHFNSAENNNCIKCGMDVRDKIHYRINDKRLKK